MSINYHEKVAKIEKSFNKEFSGCTVYIVNRYPYSITISVDRFIRYYEIVRIRSIVIKYSYFRDMPHHFSLLNNCYKLERIMYDNCNNLVLRSNFLKLQKLTQLSIVDSSISNIESVFFIGIQNIEYLYIKNCSLCPLQRSVFETLVKLKELSLKNCNINQLPIKFLAKNVNLEELDIRKNNINCFDISQLSDNCSIIKDDNTELFIDVFEPNITDLKMRDNTELVIEDLKMKVYSQFEVFEIAKNHLQKAIKNIQVNEDVYISFSVVNKDTKYKYGDKITKI